MTIHLQQPKPFDRPLKILITGTTSAGKSTLLREILERPSLDCRLAVIPELARPLLERRLDLLKHQAFLQDIMFSEQVISELCAEREQPDVILCDRGSVDICAHAQLAGVEISPQWRAWHQTYDQIVVLEPADIAFEVSQLQRTIEAKSGQVIDWQGYRESQQAAILAELDQQSLPYTRLEGSVSNRIDILTETIRILREGRSGGPERW